MVTFTYTALRNIKSGHTADLAYAIEIEITQGEILPNPIQQQHIALSGNTVTVVHRLDESISITTNFVSPSTTPSIDDMKEFLYSVIHGESFVFNDGVDDHNAILVGKPSVTRQGIHLSWSFTLRLSS